MAGRDAVTSVMSVPTRWARRPRQPRRSVSCLSGLVHELDPLVCVKPRVESVPGGWETALSNAVRALCRAEKESFIYEFLHENQHILYHISGSYKFSIF